MMIQDIANSKANWVCNNGSIKKLLSYQSYQSLTFGAYLLIDVLTKIPPLYSSGKTNRESIATKSRL